MARKRTIRPEEKALWKKVARSVTPLSPERMEDLERDEPKRADTVRPDPPVQDDRLIRTRMPRPHKPQAAAIHHPSVPHDRSAEKRVRRGRLDIDARIDLHGLTQAQALSSLRHFIEECLPTFGDYQDAMKGDEPFLYHTIPAKTFDELYHGLDAVGVVLCTHLHFDDIAICAQNAFPKVKITLA